MTSDLPFVKVEQIKRDCKIPWTCEGTNEIQKVVLARTVLGLNMAK